MNAHLFESIAPFRVIGDVSGARVRKVAIIFDGKTRFGPEEVTTVVILVRDFSYMFSDIDSMVQQREREAVSTS